MKNLVVNAPSIAEPIQKCPGFAKKHLADRKIDLGWLCGFGCSYCSTNEGNTLRINREKFATATETQLGQRLYPKTSPELTIAMPDVLVNLERQLANKQHTWGTGETLVVSMLTDAFSGPWFKDGTTLKALSMLLDKTSFRLRILTKNSVVGLSPLWLEFFKAWRNRVVVGLSVGSLDAAWAERVEIGTPPPAARIKATVALQGEGVPTFGMLCPIFPDALPRLDELVDAIDPQACETVWAEPFNDRANWRQVRAGYEPGSYGYEWLTGTFERGDKAAWSSYATALYRQLLEKARREGWSHKLKYLLYEGDITDKDAGEFRGLEGVLLQGPPVSKKDPRSKHPSFAAMQPVPAVSP